MPKPKNTPLRVFVPLIVSLMGLGVAYAIYKTNKPASLSQPAAPAATVAQPDTKADVKAETKADATTPTQTPARETPTAPAAPAGSPLTGLSAKVFTGEPLATFDSTVGGDTPKGLDRARVKFSPIGAGVSALTLADHFDTIKRETHYELQAEHKLAANSVQVLTPFAALAVEVTQAGQAPQIVGLSGSPDAPVWRKMEGAPAGTFEAFVVDASGAKVLRVERRFSLAAGSHDLKLTQRIENLSASPLTVRWYQTGPVDPPGDSGTYGGDKRQVRVGFLLPPDRDPTRAAVLAHSHDKARRDVLGQRVSQVAANGAAVSVYGDLPVWPNAASTEGKHEMAWLAYTNRYFGVAIHPLFDLNSAGGRSLAWIGQADRVVLDAGSGNEIVGMRLTSNPLSLGAAGGAGSSADLSLGVYVGPLDRKQIRSEPLLAALHLDKMVVYNFGGPCGFCTFDAITGLLLFVLRSLHDYIFHDWALAIIFLVVCVRTCLHPLTKWTQIRMNRFSKQMAAIGPKQKLLQEKYKDDPAKMQQETAKLWREEGISPAGFLGCLPAFAQTPVWIALSAVLFFAVELRHQGAFYGVFQSVQQKGWLTWWFLGDLAEPDGFLHFGRAIATLPILGPVTSINILPIVLGIVFFIQQKYLSPPPTTPMTPEQETQTKMMKWMTVLMFPIMMYNAPAGLALYFTVNSTLGILESKWIRAHMDKYGLLDLDKMRAEREARRKARGGAGAGNGFMAALQKYAERQQETQKKFGQDKRPGR
ncbi:MAG: membrane protein insertase YidC [Planctomycetes bacterium]|nr:membrane protein insertase YidC [Planctomycetota bacterium]